jgi:hypothetical protein
VLIAADVKANAAHCSTLQKLVVAMGMHVLHTTTGPVSSHIVVCNKCCILSTVWELTGPVCSGIQCWNPPFPSS